MSSQAILNRVEKLDREYEQHHFRGARSFNANICDIYWRGSKPSNRKRRTMIAARKKV